MGFFTKKPDILEMTLRLFLDGFPSWAVGNATKIVENIKKDPDNPWGGVLEEGLEAESTLIDCFTGAHAIVAYLYMNDAKTINFIKGSLGMADAIEHWPKRAQKFALLSMAAINEIKNRNNGDLRNSSIISFEKSNLNKGDAPMEPISWHLSYITESFISDELNERFGMFYADPLYSCFFQLRNAQLDWLVKYTENVRILAEGIMKKKKPIIRTCLRAANKLMSE